MNPCITYYIGNLYKTYIRRNKYEKKSLIWNTSYKFIEKYQLKKTELMLKKIDLRIMKN